MSLSFRLFRVADKPLRVLLYRHVVADMKAANRKKVAETVNRQVQSFLHTVLAEPHEGCAKRAVALLAELYRRHVWTDARAVNLLGAACHHPSGRVACSALRFFNGADEADGAESDDGDGEEGGDGGDAVRRRRSAEAQGAVGLDKGQVYAAYSKGTFATKKKKQAKLKREIARIKKRARREEAGDGVGRFAALHLLHDPQTWTERLLSRLHATGATSLGGWESKLLCLQVLTRCIGAHSLLVPNIYPFLQRHVAPHARDVTHILACAAQAVHAMVPPEWVAPLVRTLADNFCHDGARPEVMAVGLAAMRELALRQPLVMTPELLTDLAQYKRHKDKGVSSSARGLISLFRDLAPGLLEKKDRGKGGAQRVARGAGLAPLPYGSSFVADRVGGAELLEQHPEGESEDEEGSEGEEGSDEEEEGMEEGSDGGDDDAADDELHSGDADAGVEEKDEGEEGSDEEEDGDDEAPAAKRPRLQEAQPDSLRSLRKAAAVRSPGAALIEQERFLTDDDFKRIRALQANAAMQDAMHRLGAKRTAQEGAQAVSRLLNGGVHSADRRVDPDSLLGTHKVRSDKAARLARVMEGREGRGEFGSAADRHKKKSGGSSNKEKDKRKQLPLAARQRAAHKRMGGRKAHGKGRKKDKNFTGKKWSN